MRANNIPFNLREVRTKNKKKSDVEMENRNWSKCSNLLLHLFASSWKRLMVSFCDSSEECWRLLLLNINPQHARIRLRVQTIQSVKPPATRRVFMWESRCRDSLRLLRTLFLFFFFFFSHFIKGQSDPGRKSRPVCLRLILHLLWRPTHTEAERQIKNS